MQINPPPPDPARALAPTIHPVPAGSTLIRLFNPADRYRPTALSFRYFGPKKRFDHHRPEPHSASPREDPARGIYYGAVPHGSSTGLSSCVVEIFGDTGVVQLADWLVAGPVARQGLRLLDLRGASAMTAGTVAAVSACEHHLSQPWARYFYEFPGVYGEIDGILYPNAHNHEAAIALYERAKDKLTCSPERIMPLNHPSLRPAILEIMVNNSLIFDTL